MLRRSICVNRTVVRCNLDFLDISSWEHDKWLTDQNNKCTTLDVVSSFNDFLCIRRTYICQNACKHAKIITCMKYEIGSLCKNLYFIAFTSYLLHGLDFSITFPQLLKIFDLQAFRHWHKEGKSVSIATLAEMMYFVFQQAWNTWACTSICQIKQI